jgi:predicted  nucleic acid-binding Zn-ribbon protein
MSKVKIQCTNCGKQYKTEHPEIVIRFCKNCNQEIEFELVTKKPVADKRAPVDVLCRHCEWQTHFPTGKISSECPHCHQKGIRPAESETITDTILRMLTGGNDKEKWFLKIQVGKDGVPWWTVPKDSFGDDIDPFIGDSKKLSSSSYQGEFTRSDNIKPVTFGQGTITKRFIK